MLSVFKINSILMLLIPKVFALKSNVIPPLNETHFVVVMELIRQEVSLKCVKEDSSTERRSYSRQVNGSPQLLC